MTNVAKAMNIELIMNKNIAPPKNVKLPTANPYPAGHRGGIKAVAMAIPAIVFVISLYLLKATIRVSPPAIAIITSLTSGFVLANNSGVCS